MGIWLIIYQVLEANRDEYLDWFHEVHIPEKLARPGYDWAAHYLSNNVSNYAGGDHNEPDNLQPLTCVALFGSDSSRTFYDPSPAQLKPKQDEMTRKMIGFRENVRMMILSEEWSSSDTTSDLSMHAFLQVQVFAAEQADQNIGAWCAQQQFPKLQSDPDCRYATKLIASTGSQRHAVLQFRDKEPDSTSTLHDVDTVDSQLAMPQVELTLLARRCWPQL